MKLKLIISSMLILIMGCGEESGSGKKETAQNEKKETGTNPNENKSGKPIFEIKAAKIEFKYTDVPEPGTETLYFDDYGAVAVLIVDKKSKYSVTKQTTIWKDKKSTIIDHEKKTVVKSPWRPKATEPPAIADTPEETRKNIGYEKVADENIAGKNCEVWFNAKQNVKYWLWKKVDLKEVIGKGYTKEATSVEEISEIPASVLEIPKDYKQ